MKQYELVECITPTVTTGRIYSYTKKGRQIAEETFNIRISIAEDFPNFEWYLHSYIVRGTSRRIIFDTFLTTYKNPKIALVATDVRNILRESRISFALTWIVFILKELTVMGLIDFTPIRFTKKRIFKAYKLTGKGNAFYSTYLKLQQNKEKQMQASEAHINV